MIRALLAISALMIATAAFAGDDKPVKKMYDKPPEMKIDTNKKYLVTLDTSKGKIVLELFPKEAPKTVNSFVFLAREGFYDGVIFHRVIPGFMIQTGDPTGTGMGGPGYQFENENKDTKRTYETGTVGMANAGPDTNGSQFFIMDAPNKLPPPSYTIFGQLKEGQDVVHAIATADRNAQDRPNEQITLKSVKISEE